MKKELRVLLFSMVSNLFLAIMKIIGGFLFGLTSLFVDGLHTFTDFLINILSAVGAKLSRKRPTKHHPYGFGRIEYLTNLFVGIFLFLIGVYIFSESFHKNDIIPPVSILWFLLGVCTIKGITLLIMYKRAKKIKSKILLVSAKEGLADIYSTIGVAVITVLLQLSIENPILSYSDSIGTFIISVIIMRTAAKIVVENSLSLIGEIEEDPHILEKTVNFLRQYSKDVKAEDIYLIKSGAYYILILNLRLNSALTLRKATKLENKIQREIIRHKSLRVKYVNIHIEDN